MNALIEKLQGTIVELTNNAVIDFIQKVSKKYKLDESELVSIWSGELIIQKKEVKSRARCEFKMTKGRRIGEHCGKVAVGDTMRCKQHHEKQRVTKNPTKEESERLEEIINTILDLKEEDLSDEEPDVIVESESDD